ncbi:MAG: ComEC/Rec2 family competence protein [Cumulibacter sp.]
MRDWRDHDARLAPAAATIWTVTALGEFGASGVLTVCVVASIGLALLSAPAAKWTALRRGVAILLGCCALAGAGAASLAAQRVNERESSPLAAAAAADAFVTIDGTAQSRARLVGDHRAVVEVHVRAVTYRSETLSTDLNVTVIGEAQTWQSALPGMSVQVRGRAHTPDGPSSEIALIIDSGQSTLAQRAPRWSVLAHHVRDGLQRAAAVNDPDSAGLLAALVHGDTSGISDVTTQEFRRSGLAHLLAVSGANVAIVTGAALWAARLLRAPFVLQVGAAAAALIAFVLITGSEPSVVRAAGMGVVMLIALGAGRPRAAVPALCSAIIVILLLMPELAVSIGFVLSVLATAGVVVIGGYWTEVLAEHMPRFVAAAFAVAAAAGIATLPVIVLLLPVVNTASILANIVAAPAVPVATICGVLAALCASFAMPVAELLCWVAGYCVRWIALVARIAADADPFEFPLPAGVAATLIVTAALLVVVGAAALARGRAWMRVALGAFLVGALVLSVPARLVIDSGPGSDWVFASCDVGQGDATLARVSEDSAVLFDAGADPAALDECLDEMEVSAVPLILLTHFHADHVAGIPAVLGRREVQKVVFGMFDGGSAETTVREFASTHRVPVEEVAVGWQQILGGVHLEVVAPSEPMIGTSSDPNNNSLVIRVSTRGVTMLVTGDLQEESEAELVDCGCLSVDVLKVPHHGSKNRDDEFFKRTRARIALISAGEGNDYGHPAPSTVDELRSLGMLVRRTDLHGTIVVVLTADGDLAVV